MLNEGKGGDAILAVAKPTPNATISDRIHLIDIMGFVLVIGFLHFHNMLNSTVKLTRQHRTTWLWWLTGNYRIIVTNWISLF